MAEPFLSSPAPSGDAELVVEDDGRAVYLYLHFGESSGQGTKGVWVRNRVSVPAQLGREGLRSGESLLLPATHLARAEVAPALERERCRVVWLPEGTGVGLYEGPELVAAVVPGEAIGYARDAVRAHAVAQPMTDGVRARFSAASRYWSTWEDSPLKWEMFRRELMSQLERALGPQRACTEVDGGEWPPLVVGTYESERAVALVTTGMSQRPLPGVEQARADAASHRRVELGVLLQHGMNEALRARLAMWLRSAARYPWERLTWFGHGHTVPTDAFGPAWAGVVLAESSRLAPSASLPNTLDGEASTLLWAVPVTAGELAEARTRGSQGVLDRLTLPRPLTAAA